MVEGHASVVADVRHALHIAAPVNLPALGCPPSPRADNRLGRSRGPPLSVGHGTVLRGIRRRASPDGSAQPLPSPSPYPAQCASPSPVAPIPGPRYGRFLPAARPLPRGPQRRKFVALPVPVARAAGTIYLPGP